MLMRPHNDDKTCGLDIHDWPVNHFILVRSRISLPSRAEFPTFPSPVRNKGLSRNSAIRALDIRFQDFRSIMNTS